MAFLSSNVRYPSSAQKAGMGGVVVVPDASSADKAKATAALKAKTERIVRMIPKWKSSNHAVTVLLPMEFK